MRKLLKIFAWTFGIVLGLLAIFVGHANYRIANDEVNTIDAEAPGRFIAAQGHRLHVQTIGDLATDPTGAPLMLLHGFAMSGHTTYLPWARNELAPKRALILPDMLGYGFSERLTEPGEYYTLKSYARDLAAILDTLGIDQVDLAGHSWGGIVATQFARDYPGRVRRLVIIDGAFFFPKNSPLEKIIALPLGIGSAVTWHALAGGPKSYVGIICKRQPSCEPAAATTRVRSSTEALRAAMHTSRASTQIADLEADLANVTTPTLVLWGAEDPIVPVATAERLAREIPSAQLVVVENAWHLPWLEEPKETARHLLHYFSMRYSTPARVSSEPR